ncbi:MAG: SAM-dependent chlorinase/fluorinase [Rubrobacteraceae bacterium]
MRPICFLSDFGFSDDFVGTCKGVMARIEPGANVIDLTHEVPGFEVEAGAEILKHATRYMPLDTIYLAVVDPGVGTQRRALAVRTGDGPLMVGPDNGLLLPVAESLGGITEAIELTNGKYHVQPVSSTFHGRDIFAPAAAHLAAGVDLSELGREVDPGSLVPLVLPGFETVSGSVYKARILDIDRYGNARLSVMQDELPLKYGAKLQVDSGDGEMPVRYLATFGAASDGELVLVPDSHWRLSLAINKGNAAHALALHRGDFVLFRVEDSQNNEPS